MKKLSIIIPAYNEKDTILELINKVKKADIKDIKKEIIIIDDCSKDGTRDIIKNIAGCKVFFHNKNMGKGSAIRTGLKYTTGDIILIQDADLEYNPNNYSKLINPIINRKTDVVYGSRFKYKDGNFEKNKTSHFIHAVGNKFLTKITNILFSSNLTDMETCYKVFTRKVINKVDNLKAKRFDFEPEITAKILKHKFKITEVPIEYYSRDFKEGKKITWKDGIKALFVLLKYKFFD